MFVITLTYHQPIDVVEPLTESHKEWLKKYYAQGAFIASGRKVPRTGGLFWQKVLLAKNWIRYWLKIRLMQWLIMRSLSLFRPWPLSQLKH